MRSSTVPVWATSTVLRMNNPPAFAEEERDMLVTAIDREISYRLMNRTRMSEIHRYRKIKKKLEAMETYKEG
ncbi:hypothetical protein D3C81_908760 [compost metagenome]